MLQHGPRKFSAVRSRRTLFALCCLVGFGLWATMMTFAIAAYRSGVVPPAVREFLLRPAVTQITLNAPTEKAEQKQQVTAVTVQTAVVADEEKLDANGFPVGFQKKMLSDWPGLKLYHLIKILTPKEAEHIIGLARPYLERSKVVNAQQGKQVGDVVSNVRTSEGMFLQSDEHMNDPVVRTFRARLSAVTGFPQKNMEATQVLRYEGGGYYRPHPDYFSLSYDELLKRGGQRVCTVLCYLNTPEIGGGTRFPHANIEVGAATGNCVWFYSLKQDLKTVDSLSWHEGLPPGPNITKWSMPTWIREFEFR